MKLSVVVKGSRWTRIPGIAAVYYYIAGVQGSLRRYCVTGNGVSNALTRAKAIGDGLSAGYTILEDDGVSVDLLAKRYLYVSKASLRREAKTRFQEEGVVMKRPLKVPKAPTAKVKRGVLILS